MCILPVRMPSSRRRMAISIEKTDKTELPNSTATWNEKNEINKSKLGLNLTYEISFCQVNCLLPGREDKVAREFARTRRKSLRKTPALQRFGSDMQRSPFRLVSLAGKSTVFLKQNTVHLDVCQNEWKHWKCCTICSWKFVPFYLPRHQKQSIYKLGCDCFCKTFVRVRLYDSFKAKVNCVNNWWRNQGKDRDDSWNYVVLVSNTNKQQLSIFHLPK